MRGRGGRRLPLAGHAGKISAMSTVAVFGREEVLAAVPAAEAIDRTREAFVRHERGEWVMPAKVYVDAPRTVTSGRCPPGARGSRSSSG